MLFWLNWVKGLLKSLHDDTSPNEVAGAFVLGATIGLIPKGNLTTLILFVFTWIIRVNIGVAFLAITIFAILGHFTDPYVEKLGFWLLAGVPALKGLWTTLYNTPILPYLAFNNTLVMGNLIAGALLAIPLFLAIRVLIVAYRVRYRERVMRSKVMTLFQATKLYENYVKWVKPE